MSVGTIANDMPAGLRRAVFFRAATIRVIQSARYRADRQGCVEWVLFGAAPGFHHVTMLHAVALYVYHDALVSAKSRR